MRRLRRVEFDRRGDVASPPPGPRRDQRRQGRGRARHFRELSRSRDLDPPRFPTGIAELDRVLGGGLVPGSAVLVGGDPGIGKSTLLLQAAAALARAGHARRLSSPAKRRRRRCASARQRLGLGDAPVQLGTETNVADILATLGEGAAARRSSSSIPMQTLWSDGVDAAPGTISQLRGCGVSARPLCQEERRGRGAGRPCHQGRADRRAEASIEHMVDAVLYFEGQSGHQFRILRAVKNRFGPTDEIGVFEMTRRRAEARSRTPPRSSSSDRDDGAPGTAVFAGMEGTRPMLVEIQALVAPSSLGMPRRAVVGWDPKRLVDGARGA